MKKVMILGAGPTQVPLIKKSKELGFFTLVASIDGDYPGIELADVFLSVDICDKEAVLREAIKYKIDGVLTTGTELGVETIGYINDRLSLPGISYEAAKLCTNKILMKKKLLQNNIRTANFKIVGSFQELKDFSIDIGFPVIVKAVDSSGSRGITKASSVSELEVAYKNAFNFTKQKEVIVEEFLEGIEIGVQALVKNKKNIKNFIHYDETTGPPVSIPIGHAMPMDIDNEMEIKINNLIEKAMNAFGLDNLISNVDLMLVNGDPYIIEIGARMGATCLPENISIYEGFDAYETILNLSLGIDFQFSTSSEKQPNAVLLLFSEKTGNIKKIKIEENLLNNKNIVGFQIFVKEGDFVNKFTSGNDRLGYIITTGETKKEALDLAHHISKKIEFIVFDYVNINSIVHKKSLIYNDVRITNCKINEGAAIGDFSRIRDSILGIKVIIDRNNYIESSVVEDYSYTGKNSSIIHSKIGKFCSISWNVTIGGGEHDYTRMAMHSFLYNDHSKIRPVDIGAAYDRFSEGVTIGSDVWVAAGAVITRGVTIGDGAVVGANAVVTRDIPPYAVAVGNPAKIIKYRFDEEIIALLLKIKWWEWSLNKIKKNYNLISNRPNLEILKNILNNDFDN